MTNRYDFILSYIPEKFLQNWITHMCKLLTIRTANCWGLKSQLCHVTLSKGQGEREYENKRL